MRCYFEEKKMQSNKSHIPDWREAISLIVRRIYHSFGYGVLYGFVLLLNLGLIIWLVKDKGEPKPKEQFIMLEAVVTVALVLEIAYTLKTQGFRNWISDLSNWFDFLVAVVCVLSLGAYAVGEELQEEVAVGVASARYTAQALRLGALLRHARRKNPEVIGEFEQVKFDVNFENLHQNQLAEAQSANTQGEQSRSGSPTLAYWGRGRAFSASPIFQNTYFKRASLINLGTTRIQAEEAKENDVPLSDDRTLVPIPIAGQRPYRSSSEGSVEDESASFI
jgi:hypothetical protein